MTNNDQPHDLGDGPVEDQYRHKMIAITKTLDDFLNGHERPRAIGFLLMVFPYDSTDGRCNYMSNGANRKDIVKLMREQIARFESLKPEDQQDA